MDGTKLTLDFWDGYLSKRANRMVLCRRGWDRVPFNLIYQ